MEKKNDSHRALGHGNTCILIARKTRVKPKEPGRESGGGEGGSTKKNNEWAEAVLGRRRKKGDKILKLRKFVWKKPGCAQKQLRLSPTTESRELATSESVV